MKLLIADTIFTPPTAEKMKWWSIRWFPSNQSCGSSITFFLWKEFLLFEGLGLFLWLQRHQCVGFYPLTSTIWQQWGTKGNLQGPLLSPNKENDDSSNLTLCCLLDRKLSRKVEKMEYCPPPPFIFSPPIQRVPWCLKFESQWRARQRIKLIAKIFWITFIFIYIIYNNINNNNNNNNNNNKNR